MLEFSIVDNNVSIKIEGKMYYIHESYILNGTGYTFGIYKSSKMYQSRDNVFQITSNYSQFVIIGKKYNYLLVKNKEEFGYTINKYKKNILKIISDSFKQCAIYLGNTKLVSFYANIKELDIIKNESEIINKIIRFDKLKEINKNE